MKPLYESKSLKTSFDDQFKMVILKCSHDFSLDDAIDFNNHIRAILDEKNFTPENPLNVLADMTDVTRLPFKLTDMSDSINLLYDDRIAILMVVVPPGVHGKVIKFIGGVVTKLTSRHFKTFSKVADAYEFLKSSANQ